MPSFAPTFRHWLICLGCLLLLFALPGQAQGFGSSKKKLILHRKLPPTAHMSGNTFAVQVTSHDVQQDISNDLRSSLETELLRDDARLRVAEKDAETLILCNVTQYAQPPPTTSTRSNYELGSKKPVSETVTRYTGLLTIAYQAKDRKSGRTLDSQNITAKFDDEFNQNGSTKGSVTTTLSNTFNRIRHGKSEADTPPTSAELRNRLLSDAVSQIAARLVNTDEPVEVLLARGKLDEANKQAEAGLWSRNLETLETMTAFPNKADDAYRLYNIGVAYEALAYASEDQKAAKKNLEDAAINYGKAINDKPDEKYFLTPQARIETAIAHYKVLSEQPTVAAGGGSTSTASTSTTAASKSSKSASSHTTHTASAGSGGTTKGASGTASSKPSSTAAKAPALTNDKVIAMVKANLDEENIIDTIRTAPSVSFDLSVDGEINLAKNGVKGKILTAMKQRARQSSAHRAASE